MKAFIVAGFVLLGYIIPEWVFIFSPYAKELRRMPRLQNIVTAIAFGCIAMGIF